MCVLDKLHKMMHAWMCVCVYTVRVRGMCQPICWRMTGVSLLQKKEKECPKFSLSLSLFRFVTSIGSAWSGLGGWPSLYCKSTSRDTERSLNKRVRRSSRMNLCKWLFDNVASLICQLCLLEQTMPCRATQSSESADSAGEIKIFLRRGDGTQVWLSVPFGSSVRKIKLASRAGCFSDPVVWSVVLYGFCLCCFLCLQWSKDRPLLSHVPLSSGFPSVLLLQCNHGVLHYF